LLLSPRPAGARLGARPHRPRMGDADEAPRLHALCRPRRRRGRRRDGHHGRHAPEGVARIHGNFLTPAVGIGDRLSAKSEQERAAKDAVATFKATGFGYFLEQSTRPQTIGYSLLESTIRLAA